MSSEPDPETGGSLSDLEPLLPVRNYAVGSGHSVALDPAPSSSSSTTIATQTVPLPDSVESSLLGGLPPDPIYVVWRIGDVSTLPAGIHTGATAWTSILKHIPGGKNKEKHRSET
eukprot:5989047-Amphidinium_carterae.1